MLLVDDQALDARRRIAADALAPLARSLRDDLTPLLDRELFIPKEKAVLSREGGRCAHDGALLEFDPFNRDAHRCPICGTVHTGELHYRFWIYWYQLWLIERAVHASLLSALGIDGRAGALAERILTRYAEAYVEYPNADNVLGPSRLFFSTYLESIWLLNVCVATDFLDVRNASLAERVRDRIIEPARDIITQFDEGRSNRQVWNDAALLAAAQLLGDDRAAEDAVYGGSGIATHLGENLLVDGTWYEGENYHLFAHRGLWYGVTMAERAEIELPAMLRDRFQLGFATPFATALPDFTLPSRRDSQYAISLRQWRIAEHCELGVARRADTGLLAGLARMYEGSNDDVPHDTGRARSSADVERNSAPSLLSRADLSWRALLFARAELPPLEDATPRSTLLDAQGLAAFRRGGGQVYVALDYGNSGGGHGHADRLNVMLVTGTTRWLDDFGTGSYVDPSLHWYRSTLAHNAPLVDGHSQLPVNGELVAYEETERAGWICATVDELAPGVSATRILVVTSTYCVDVLRWEADGAVVMALPLHVDAELVSPSSAAHPETLRGGPGLEDGFDFLRDTAVQRLAAHSGVHARAMRDEATLDLFASFGVDSEWWGATAPGAPGSGDHRFRMVRAQPASSGEMRMVWSWAGEIVDVVFDDDIRVTLRDGTQDRHASTEDGWRIESAHNAALRITSLGGVVPTPSQFYQTNASSAADALTLDATGKPLPIALGEVHYRRSEQSWHDAGEPRATVTLAWKSRALRVTVDVPRSDRTFVQAGATNPHDNERAEINGDGVQLYVRDADGKHAWLLVPVADSTDVRQIAIDAWQFAPSPFATWQPTSTGYRMDVSVPISGMADAVDVIVNEMPRGRVRRRGQLVLSGSSGDFVYLRGDRQDPDRLVPLRLSND